MGQGLNVRPTFFVSWRARHCFLIKPLIIFCRAATHPAVRIPPFSAHSPSLSTSRTLPLSRARQSPTHQRSPWTILSPTRNLSSRPRTSTGSRASRPDLSLRTQTGPSRSSAPWSTALASERACSAAPPAMRRWTSVGRFLDRKLLARALRGWGSSDCWSDGVADALTNYTSSQPSPSGGSSGAASISIGSSGPILLTAALILSMVF